MGLPFQDSFFQQAVPDAAGVLHSYHDTLWQWVTQPPAGVAGPLGPVLITTPGIGSIQHEAPHSQDPIHLRRQALRAAHLFAGCKGRPYIQACSGHATLAPHFNPRRNNPWVPPSLVKYSAPSGPMATPTGRAQRSPSAS